MAEDFLLIAISGRGIKGTSWKIGGTGLVLGRESTSGVVLKDPVVSRRHCQVRIKDGAVHFQDLGSRNPALVNGEPVKDAALNPGDEISIGPFRFVLACRRASGDPGSGTSGGGDTISWDRAEPIIMDVDSTKPANVNRPRTTRDLVLLHESHRELGSAESMEALAVILCRRLEERFNPVRVWIGRVRDQEVYFLPGSHPLEDQQDPIHALMRRALEPGQALLAPGRLAVEGQRHLTSTMICPVVLGGSAIGVIALETYPPHGAYDEEDLRFLILLAQSLAPVIFALENVEQLRRDNALLRGLGENPLRILGESRGIRHLRALVSQAAQSGLHALITGETGTGKELVARNLHAQSARREQPLVVVNCAAIPRDLFEGELFGYEKGAFTGAERPSEGLLVHAHQGSMFLDEVGDLCLENQARLLRVIEYGTFRRIGAKEETQVDIRFIAATNKDLDAAIKAGAFREDLYHRLNGYEIHIPPLRERPSDIPLLAQHFFELSRAGVKHPLRGVAPETIEHLRARPWSGNVRELRNCIQRAAASARREMIMLEDVLEPSGRPAISGLEQEIFTLEEVEKRHIANILRRCGGNVPEAARILEIGRSTLYNKIAQYGL
jgi:DNA-binding NtrC family response regulator